MSISPIVSRLPLERVAADRPPDPHLEALLTPFDQFTRMRVKTMIERAIKLGHERTLLVEEHEAATARYERAASAGPSIWSNACSEARRERLKLMESELMAMEWRVDAIDRQFQGISK